MLAVACRFSTSHIRRQIEVHTAISSRKLHDLLKGD